MLSDEVRFLARRYPREMWASRADLGELARFWLQRHEMFRQLDAVIRDGVPAALMEQSEAAAFRPWLARHLGWSLWQLEKHRQVEDHHCRSTIPETTMACCPCGEAMAATEEELRSYST